MSFLNTTWFGMPALYSTHHISASWQHFVPKHAEVWVRALSKMMTRIFTVLLSFGARIFHGLAYELRKYGLFQREFQRKHSRHYRKSLHSLKSLRKQARQCLGKPLKHICLIFHHFATLSFFIARWISNLECSFLIAWLPSDERAINQFNKRKKNQFQESNQQ